MCGYIICLADDAGVIEKIDCIAYSSYEEAKDKALKISRASGVRFL
jgi:hypothetical protein